MVYKISTGDVPHTLILNCNGTSWTRNASPDPGNGNFLLGVSATSAKNAWAVVRAAAPQPIRAP